MVNTLTRIARAAAAASIPLVLAACQTSGTSPEVASAAAPDERALTFSQAACGGCHAVEYPALSPNPMAPTFASIANREGLDETSLASWLTDAHNYPEVMDFDLDADQVELIAEHMLSLRSSDYVPVE